MSREQGPHLQELINPSMDEWIIKGVAVSLKQALSNTPTLSHHMVLAGML